MFRTGGFTQFLLSDDVHRLSVFTSEIGQVNAICTYPNPIPILRVGDIVPDVTCR